MCCPGQRTKMKGKYGLKPIDYFDLKYKIYVPPSTEGYQLPIPYVQRLKPDHDNILVQYTLNAIHERNSQQGITGSIDEIFQDRLGLIRSKIELILLQLKERKKINQKILYRIDNDRCDAQYLVFEMGYRAYAMDRERVQLERTKLDLEREKRMEEASYFRDTGMLNRDLKDSLIQYMEEVQKGTLIAEEEVGL
jgi:hypothetical protein